MGQAEPEPEGVFAFNAAEALRHRPVFSDDAYPLRQILVTGVFRRAAMARPYERAITPAVNRDVMSLCEYLATPIASRLCRAFRIDNCLQFQAGTIGSWSVLGL